MACQATSNMKTEFNKAFAATEAANKKITFPEYLCRRSPNSMFCKVTYVIGITGLGAGIGAACGAPAGGLGAGPGAGIGAAVGLVVGVSSYVIYEFAAQYTSWAAGQKTDVVVDLSQKLKKFAEDKYDMVACAISKEIPKHPVKTPYSDEIYERSVIEEWIDKKGTCPTTIRPLKKEQLRTSISSIAKMNSICKEILQSKIKDLGLSKDQLKGVEHIMTDIKNNIDRLFKEEINDLVGELNKDGISRDELIAKLNNFQDCVHLKKVEPKKEEQKS